MPVQLRVSSSADTSERPPPFQSGVRRGAGCCGGELWVEWAYDVCVEATLWLVMGDPPMPKQESQVMASLCERSWATNEEGDIHKSTRIMEKEARE